LDQSTQQEDILTQLTNVKSTLQVLVDDINGLNIELTIAGGSLPKPDVTLAIGKLAVCIAHILCAVLSIVNPLLDSVDATVQGLVADIV
jgi:hypothetical protein